MGEGVHTLVAQIGEIGGRIVITEFTEWDWLENFRIGKDTLMYICKQLSLYTHKEKDHYLRKPISMELHVTGD